MPINCPVCFQENPDTASLCMACCYPLGATQSSEYKPYHLPGGTLLQRGKHKLRIEDSIGEGGFGITYKGMALVNYSNVAVKELYPNKAIRQGTNIIWPITPKKRQEQIEKFKNEAENLSKCVHPNIVRVYDWFEENNTVYIVMAFIEGKQISKILKESGPLPVSRVKHYFIQVASALKVVHSNNLIHRDIKPENIIIDKQDKAILIDFGAAREFMAGQTGRMTEILTPGYAPPEQYSFVGRRGSSTDFYAVCACMYELLTGTLPLEAISRYPVDALIPPRQIAPLIDSLTEKIILTGLRMQVDERFQTADELIEALKGNFFSPSLRQARRLVAQGKLPEAVSAYEKCVANEPDNGEVAVELVAVLIYIDDSKAEVAARRAIQLKPNNATSYGVLGLINCRKGNYSEAVKQLQQAAALDPNQSWIQANLAWALGKIGKWQPAETAADRAIQLDSNLVFALGVKAWIAANQGKWKAVIPAASKAIFKSKQPNVYGGKQLQHWVYPCLIVALDRALVGQKTPDIDTRLQEFIIQLPDSAFALGFQGWQPASLGQWAKALPSFKQAISQARVPEWVFLNLGITHERLNNSQEAIQVYKLCSQKFSNNPFTWFRLGTLLGQQGQWLTARSYLEQAVQLNPDYAEAYHNLGWVLLNIRNQNNNVENLHEIRAAYRKAVQLYERQQKHDLAQYIKKTFNW